MKLANTTNKFNRNLNKKYKLITLYLIMKFYFYIYLFCALEGYLLKFIIYYWKIANKRA